MPELLLPAQNPEDKDTVSCLQFGFAQVEDTAPDRPLWDEEDESVVPKLCQGSLLASHCPVSALGTSLRTSWGGSQESIDF